MSRQRSPKPTDQSYQWLTAFVTGVNEAERKLAMRAAINRLAAERGEPYKRFGETDTSYLQRILKEWKRK